MERHWFEGGNLVRLIDPATIVKEQALIHQLVALNKAQNGVMKKLDILTSSPYIISDKQDYMA